MTHKEFSKLGGQAGRGASKARTREQCQAAARARWSGRNKLSIVTDVPPDPLPAKGRPARTKK